MAPKEVRSGWSGGGGARLNRLLGGRWQEERENRASSKNRSAHSAVEPKAVLHSYAIC